MSEIELESVLSEANTPYSPTREEKADETPTVDHEYNDSGTVEKYNDSGTVEKYNDSTGSTVERSIISPHSDSYSSNKMSLEKRMIQGTRGDILVCSRLR